MTKISIRKKHKHNGKQMKSTIYKRNIKRPQNGRVLKLSPLDNDPNDNYGQHLFSAGHYIKLLTWFSLLTPHINPICRQVSPWSLLYRFGNRNPGLYWSRTVSGRASQQGSNLLLQEPPPSPHFSHWDGVVNSHNLRHYEGPLWRGRSRGIQKVGTANQHSNSQKLEVSHTAPSFP